MDLLCPFCGCGGLLWMELYYLCPECRSAVEESLVDEVELSCKHGGFQHFKNF